MSQFPTTNWSDLRLLRQEDADAARLVLERLCGLYWQPVYAAVRRSGCHCDSGRLSMNCSMSATGIAPACRPTAR